MREQVFLFGKKLSLVGIITDPPEALRGDNLSAVVLLNAGIAHRVGPHRLYVKMARSLAAIGFVVFRFDYSGIGDSKARDDNLPFEKSAVNEAQEAMNYLNSIRGIKQFIIIGLCTATALRTASSDPRVVGGVLINALLDFRHNVSEDLISYILNRKVARNYWQIELFNPKGWLKVIKGKASYRRIINSLSAQLKSLFTPKRNMLTEAKNVPPDLCSLIERGVNLLLVYSEGGTTLDYIRLTIGNYIHELNACGKLRLEIIEHADHTFTLIRHQEQVIKIICDWAHAKIQP